MSNQLSEIMFVVEEADDGSYRASAVGESIYTEADNLENLHSEIRDAVQCHFEDAIIPAMPFGK